MPGSSISKWHYVYVLRSEKDKNLYIGYTTDLAKRVNKHNAKQNFSTNANAEHNKQKIVKAINNIY